MNESQTIFTGSVPPQKLKPRDYANASYANSSHLLTMTGRISSTSKQKTAQPE